MAKPQKPPQVIELPPLDLADLPPPVPDESMPVETWVRVVRRDYLTIATEELQTRGGVEVGRREIHPRDAAPIALGYAMKALEEMVR